MAFDKKIKRGNNTYIVRVQSYRKDGKVKHKYLGYVGKEVDGKKILSSSISNIEIESVKVYGPLIVLDSLAKKLKLAEILGEFGEEILSMVYAHCVEPKSINQMQNWFKKTDLNFILDLENVTEFRLLKALDSINQQDSEVLQKKIFDEVKKNFKIDTTGILYDVTNTYFYGKKCPWGKRGHSKENQKDKPLVQIGLGVTRKEGIPVFHKTFDGNINDTRVFHATIPMFEKFKIKKGFFVYDRGIISEENLSDVKKLGWDSICGLPISNDRKKIVREIINRKEIINIENRVRLSKCAMYSVSERYNVGGVDGKLVLCLNNKIKTEIQESRYDEIQSAQERIENSKNIKTGLNKYFKNNELVKQNEINKSEEFDGYSGIFSTKQIPNNEIVKLYFEKDLVEKAFQNLKGVIALRPIRHWMYDRVEGHIFICYLAYLLLSLLKYKLKKTDIGPIEALRELESLHKIYMKDTEKGFELTKLVKLNRKQEKIIRAVDKNILKM